jgi:pimeloyl-ACP methyl ester carboxylesterase
MVLLHGFASSVHWYDRLLPLLVDDHRVIRVDLRGHGLTGGDTGLDAPEQAEMVEAVLEKLEVTGACFVGHSFGADVALLAAQQPGLASTVVLLSQAPDYSYARFPAGQTLLTLPVLGSLAHRLAPPPIVRITGRIAFAPGFRQSTGFDDPDQLAADHAAMTPAMYKTVLTVRRQRLARRPLDALIQDLEVPVLAIHGRADQIYDWAKTVARYEAAGAQVAVVDGAGHSPQVERPGKVALLIEEFLESQGEQ